MSTDTRIFPMSFSYRDNYPVVKLKRSQIFVIGDNFDSSMDSRFFGPLDEDLLVGKLVYKI
jgi:type IV secretory pathway protease TraF